MKKNEKPLTVYEAYERASARCRDAESRNLSVSTINRRYRELFAAEDALKSAMGVWA